MKNHHIILPDVQVKPNIDFSYLSQIGEYIAERKPDIIINLGDFGDMPSLSTYDVGKKDFEGRSYKDDIECTKEAMQILLEPIYKEIDKLKKGKRKLWKPRMVFTLGNHECYDKNTEVLTRNGWKLFKEIEDSDYVYTMNEDLTGEWQKPTEKIIKHYKGKMLYYSSRTVDLCITPNHRILWTNNNSGKIYENLAKNTPNNCDVFVSAKFGKGIELSNEQIIFNAIALTDSYHGNESLTFYQSGEKANRIRECIKNVNVKFTEKERNRDITHICGKKLKNTPKTSYEFYMKKPVWSVDQNKRIPKEYWDMSQEQFDVFLEMLIFCDGTKSTKSKNSFVFYGRKEICEDLQSLSVTKGYRATLTEYRIGQYRVNIVKTNLCRTENFLTNEIDYNDYVYCLSVPNGNLMVRRNGKPLIQGNCRIDRAINLDRKLDGLISINDLEYEKFGWEVIPFLRPISIDGICYAHYMVSGVMGNPIGRAVTLVNKMHMSTIVGHQQGRDIAYGKRADGKRITGIIAGSCLHPSHKILTADLRYVPLTDIKVGDKIVSFDERLNEKSGLRKSPRRFKTGIVNNLKISKGEMFDVTLSSGKVFRVTEDHLWFTKNTGSLYSWKTTKELRCTKESSIGKKGGGTRIVKLLEEFEHDNSWESGWLAGMYCGEGSLYHRKTTGGSVMQLTISQSYVHNPNTCEIIEQYMKQICNVDLYSMKSKNRNTHSYRITGGAKKIATVLGTIRPHRMLDKFIPEMLGSIGSKSKQEPEYIVSIKYIGIDEYMEIDIDEKTMIIEGYGHHNCYLHDEIYLNHQSNNHWRGFLEAENVEDGEFDEHFINLENFIKK